MPTLNATDLTKRLTGQADKSGVFVMQPSVSNDTVCFENHQTDARTTESDVAPTMGASRNAQASNNNPLVVAPAGGVVAIDMDKNKPTNADKPVRKGGAGFGVSEKGASYTLTARDQHAVAYAIDSMGSNAMKSKNPKSGCREVECAPTLTTVDPAPVKHQGGMTVVGVFDMGARKTGAESTVVSVGAHSTSRHPLFGFLDFIAFDPIESMAYATACWSLAVAVLIHGMGDLANHVGGCDDSLRLLEVVGSKRRRNFGRNRKRLLLCGDADGRDHERVVVCRLRIPRRSHCRGYLRDDVLVVARLVVLKADRVVEPRRRAVDESA